MSGHRVKHAASCHSHSPPRAVSLVFASRSSIELARPACVRACVRECLGRISLCRTSLPLPMCRPCFPKRSFAQTTAKSTYGATDQHICRPGLDSCPLAPAYMNAASLWLISNATRKRKGGQDRRLLLLVHSWSLCSLLDNLYDVGGAKGRWVYHEGEERQVPQDTRRALSACTHSDLSSPRAGRRLAP